LVVAVVEAGNFRNRCLWTGSGFSSIFRGSTFVFLFASTTKEAGVIAQTAVPQDERSEFTVKTKFGDVAVCAVPVNGKRVLIVAEQAEIISQEQRTTLLRGTVLHSSNRWVNGRHDVYENLWDAASGLRWASLRATKRDAPRLAVHREALHGALRFLLAYGGLKDAALAQATRLARETARPLATAQNDHTGKAFLKLVGASKGTDRRGRPNPGKVAAQIVSAKDAIWKRLEEIDRIYPFLDADVLAILSTINEYHDRFRVVDSFGKHWSLRTTQRTPLSIDEAKQFMEDAREARILLMPVHGRPYVWHAEQIRGMLAMERHDPETLDRFDVRNIARAVVDQTVAVERVKAVFELNVENAFLQQSALRDAEFFAAVRTLRERTMNTLWKATHAVPKGTKTHAVDAIEDVKTEFGSAGTTKSRAWMLRARKAVREFASYIG
jgi:hypothetical protein